MRRKLLILTAIVLVFSACEVQAAVIDSNWVGGGRGFWETPSNWDPAIVPDNDVNTFAIIVDSNSIGVPHVEILIQQDHTIDRLSAYGKVELESHNWQYNPDLTLTEPNNGIVNNGRLKIKELDIYGDVLNTTGSSLTGNDVDIDGNLFNTTGARFDCYEGELDTHGGTIYNDGSILIAPTGSVWAEYEFQNFGEVEIYGGLCSSDQTFTNESTGVIKGFGIVHSDQVINNAGIIQSLGGGLVLHSRVDFEGPNVPNWGIINTGKLTNSPGTSLTAMVWIPDVNNEGTIEVNADGSVIFDCNLNNEPNAVIKLLGGTLAAGTITQSVDANFVGFGGINGDIVIDPNGIIKLTGPTNIIGDVNIPANATLEISDGTTLVTGDCTCNNGTVHMIGGRIIIQGEFTNNNCEIIWEPGLYTNVADFNLDGTVNMKDFAFVADTWLWQASWY